MSSDTILNLSVLELLQALNEKLGSECTRLQETRLPPGPTFAAVLETEASAHRSIHPDERGGGS